MSEFVVSRRRRSTTGRLCVPRTDSTLIRPGSTARGTNYRMVQRKRRLSVLGSTGSESGDSVDSSSRNSLDLSIFLRQPPAEATLANTLQIDDYRIEAVSESGEVVTDTLANAIITTQKLVNDAVTDVKLATAQSRQRRSRTIQSQHQSHCRSTSRQQRSRRQNHG